MGEKERSRLVGGGLVLLGVVALLNGYLQLGDVSGPLFLLIVGAGLTMGWARNGSVGLLIAGMCTCALGLFAGLTEAVGLGDWEGPLFFLTQGFAFLAVHLLQGSRPAWARNTALGLGAFAAFVLMAEGTADAGKYVFPVILIGIGAYLFIGKGTNRNG